MPKNSGQQGNRSLGLNHGAGKGDKTRVTDVKTYRENYDGIDWSNKKRPFLTLQELHDEWEFRHGL